MKGVRKHLPVTFSLVYLGKQYFTATGTISAPNGVSTAFATTGVPIRLTSSQLIRILNYWFDLGDAGNTGTLFLTQPYAIDIQLGASPPTAVLQEFTTQGMLDSSILQAAPAAKGMLLTNQKVGAFLNEHWINWDDFTQVSQNLTTLTIAGKQSVENNDVVAHNVTWFEGCLWEVYEAMV